MAGTGKSGQPIMIDRQQQTNPANPSVVANPTGESNIMHARQQVQHASAPNKPERADFQLELYRLFEESVRRYTGGASKTVSESLAERLMESILFVLESSEGEGDQSQSDPVESGLPQSDPLEDNLQCRFNQGCTILLDQAHACKPLWQQICTAMPQLNNVALHDTLASIEGFWNVYDPRLFAQEDGTDIDYPLAWPIEENATASHSIGRNPQGPTYVKLYLQRLLAEARFLARFDDAACKHVLQASCPDWQGLLVNLYEPIAARAIICAMDRASGSLMAHDNATDHKVSSGDLDMLTISHVALQQLKYRLATMDRTQVIAILDNASKHLAIEIKLTEAESEYLSHFAHTLQPRLSAGGLRGVASYKTPLLD